MSCHLTVCRSRRLPSTLCHINVCAVKAGSGSCYQGECHPGAAVRFEGDGKVWRWQRALKVAARSGGSVKVERQRQGREAAARSGSGRVGSRGGGKPVVEKFSCPASCSCPASASCPPSTQIIMLCAVLYAGGGGSGAGDVPCAGGAGQGRVLLRPTVEAGDVLPSRRMPSTLFAVNAVCHQRVRR
jgi:hypothetical protein